jgi:hypothetical protein
MKLETSKWIGIFRDNEKLENESVRSYCARLAIKHKVSFGTVYKAHYVHISSKKKRDLEQYKTDKIETNKSTLDNFDWRNAIEPLQKLQKEFKNHKGSQDLAEWKIKTNKPICILTLADTHMGSWATDYDRLIEITDEIVNTPNLYVILLGDLLQMSIKLRGVLEVADNALPPYWQIRFLDSWLQTIKHKVICSTWDNHSVMREENAVGFSSYAEIFKRHTIYHNGIGHVDVTVGKQVYKIAVSHFFRGRTMYNPCHGQMRYIRMEANDREIVAAGDSHVHGVVHYMEGGKPRLVLNCGSIQNSGYGKRFFSLKNQDYFPCFTLDPKEHRFVGYRSVSDYLKSK